MPDKPSASGIIGIPGIGAMPGIIGCMPGIIGCMPDIGMVP
jgi:hypothetical protein